MLDLYPEDPTILGNHIKPQHFFVGPKINKTYKMELGLSYILTDVITQTGGQEIDNLETILPHAHKGSEEIVIEDFDKKTLRRVQNFYEKDFEKFDYDINLPR